MTTYSTPITQKSIPPGLSETLTPDTLKHIRNRLEAHTKEYNRSERRVNKVLRTTHINFIPLTSLELLPPTALPPRHLPQASSQKGRAASCSGADNMP